ncbi:ankyrin repeat domain-containing protein, partial [Acidobacteria bacterium AH-259-A15]|nr:ankyrin repeat domain-containing protein [Acidobacteria bacterium AH-259-A15]
MPTRMIIAMMLALLNPIPACARDVNSELIEAARNGQTEKIQALLRAGADVNAKDAAGFTALRYAALRGYTSAVETLLEAGADVNVKD